MKSGVDDPPPLFTFVLARFVLTGDDVPWRNSVDEAATNRLESHVRPMETNEELTIPVRVFSLEMQIWHLKRK